MQGPKVQHDSGHSHNATVEFLYLLLHSNDYAGVRVLLSLQKLPLYVCDQAKQSEPLVEGRFSLHFFDQDLNIVKSLKTKCISSQLAVYLLDSKKVIMISLALDR